MLGVFVGGPFHGMAREMGDPPPGNELVESTPQYGHNEPNRTLTHRRAQVVDQPGGESFAIYRINDDPRGDPSPFEELLAECHKRLGNTIAVDARDIQAVRITAPGSSRDVAVNCADVHLGAIELARLLGWPRPVSPTPGA